MSKKSIFITRLTDVSDVDTEGVGSIRRENNKTYKWVQFRVGAGAVAAVVNNAVGYYAAGGVSAGETTIVTSDVSDTAAILAGSLVSVPTNLQYCWILTRGVVTIATALVSGADGNALRLSSTTDGTLKVGAAVTEHMGAVAIDASANLVFMICPD
jgi:hypothetical protein